MAISNKRFIALLAELQKSTDGAVRLLAALTNSNKSAFRNMTKAEIMQHLSSAIRHNKQEAALMHVHNNESFLAEMIYQNQIRKLEGRGINRRSQHNEFPTSKAVYEFLKISSALRGDRVMYATYAPDKFIAGNYNSLNNVVSSNDNVINGINSIVIQNPLSAEQKI